MNQAACLTVQGKGLWPPALGKLRKTARRYHEHMGLRSELQDHPQRNLQQLLPENSFQVKGLFPGSVITCLNLINHILLSAYREKVSSAS